MTSGDLAHNLRLYAAPHFTSSNITTTTNDTCLAYATGSAMAGRTVEDPISLIEDDNEDESSSLAIEVDVQGYGTSF